MHVKQALYAAHRSTLLSAHKHIFLQRLFLSRASTSSASEQLVLAKPATVPYCETHVFISLLAAAKGNPPGAQWPPVVERSEAFLEAFKAIANLQAHSATGNVAVKLTAFEPVQGTSNDATEVEVANSTEITADVLVYPDGYWYPKLPLRLIRHAITAHTEGFDSAEEAQEVVDYQVVEQTILEFEIIDTVVTARGGALLQRFTQQLSAMSQELQAKVQLYATSCVGGCQYAANVLVYGAVSPCDGDWFGSIHKGNAKQFLDAVVNMEICSEGGAAHPSLRGLWRGRTGLTQAEQAALFDDPSALIASDAEDENDADDVDSDVDDEQTLAEMELEQGFNPTRSRHAHVKHDRAL